MVYPHHDGGDDDDDDDEEEEEEEEEMMMMTIPAPSMCQTVSPNASFGQSIPD